MTEYSIFDEIKEDLERQRLEALWKKYGVFVIAAALAVVIGTAGSSVYHNWKTSRDLKLTGAYLSASDEGANPAKDIAALQEFADAHPGTNLSAFALLRAGAFAYDNGDMAKAVKLFDEAATDGKADNAFRQLGTLLSVQAQMDKGDPAALAARLQPLTAKNGTWRYAATEAQAYLALRAGDTAKAEKIFTGLAQDERAPRKMSERAADILRSLN
ncbi:MAG: tetratricopeptide repeat protein [Alphaproteobacteria bacterium]|nr:tetratricopeptide repeat protein [Alphaproteobacteria bacterium]